MKITECFYSVPAESMFDHETNSLDRFIDKIKYFVIFTNEAF